MPEKSKKTDITNFVNALYYLTIEAEKLGLEYVTMILRNTLNEMKLLTKGATSNYIINTQDEDFFNILNMYSLVAYCDDDTKKELIDKIENLEEKLNRKIFN